MMATRLRPQDCLSELFVGLCSRARVLKPWDGEARQDWIAASRDLLQTLGDSDQRGAWAIQLASASAHTMPGVPLCLIVGMLMEPPR